jgi:triacylglycerol esterase/lipase EstA (alpha/beta hydrolase family)
MQTRTLRLVAENGRRIATDVPVLLVHGYGGHTSQWVLLEHELRSAGFTSIHAMSYNAFTNDIPTLARGLVDTVHAVLAETGARRIHLVGHSLGGVIIRYAVCVLGLASVVDTAVTIASPHGGSPLARFGYGPTAVQLRPGSDLLRQLECWDRPVATRFVALSTNFDRVVPARRARIRPSVLNATNILVKNLTHLTMVASPRVTRLVADLLGGNTPVSVPLAA